MIPKVIHYCWFGGKPLPNEVKKCIESWKKYCPDYKIIEWNESNFDVNSHPFCKKAYDSKAWAFVSDYARLKIVYDNGGIYLDTDVELLKKLDFLTENNFYVGVQQMANLVNTGLGFGGYKNSEIINDLLKVYDDFEFDENILNKIQCPILNTIVLEKYGFSKRDVDKIQSIGENSYIYPSKYFDPLAPGDTQNLLTKETVSIHHYSASWTSNKNRIKRKILRLIGQKNIIKIKKLLNR